MPLSGKATVDAVADQWGKLLALYMCSQDIKEIVITEKDIEKLGPDGTMTKCLVIQSLEDGLHIKLLPLAEAQALAQQHKGGFGRS